MAAGSPQLYAGYGSLQQQFIPNGQSIVTNNARMFSNNQPQLATQPQWTNVQGSQGGSEGVQTRMFSNNQPQLATQPQWTNVQGSHGGAQIVSTGLPKGLKIDKGSDFHEQPVNENADGLRIISLGSYCGPKLTFRALGRDEATLPFDWVRTRLEGLLYYLKNDFDGFFNYVTKEVVPGAGIDKPMVTHRDYYHSFWHDDLSDKSTVDKYKRRFERIKELDANSVPILFVRSVATTDEVATGEIGELHDHLRQQFGRCAKLLAIVDFQDKDEPVLLQDRENLLVYKLHHAVHNGTMDGAPYKKPITEGIEWAKTGQLPGAAILPNLSAVSLSPTHWGMNGLGGLPAFESNRDINLTGKTQLSKSPSSSGLVPATSSTAVPGGTLSSPMPGVAVNGHYTGQVPPSPMLPPRPPNVGTSAGLASALPVAWPDSTTGSKLSSPYGALSAWPGAGRSYEVSPPLSLNTPSTAMTPQWYSGVVPESVAGSGLSQWYSGVVPESVAGYPWTTAPKVVANGSIPGIPNLSGSLSVSAPSAWTGSQLPSISAPSAMTVSQLPSISAPSAMTGSQLPVSPYMQMSGFSLGSSQRFAPALSPVGVPWRQGAWA